MDEVLTAVAEGQTTPVAQAPEPQDSTNEIPGDDKDLENTSEIEGDGLESEGDEQPEPEETEVEFNGKTYKIHPDLRDGFLMRADYTKKSMEVADIRKEAEAKREEAAQAYQTSQEVLEARSVIINIDGQLQQYENVNWDQLEQEDPLGAQSHWRRFQTLREQRGQVAQYLDKTQHELSEKVAQETDKRLRETRAFAEKELKGWTPELDNKITEFATKDLGFTVDALRSSYSPQVYKTLYLAHLGHLALQKQAAAPKPATPAAQPLSKVSARANPPLAGLDDRLTSDEWLKRRNAQVQKRG
ncbi:hypothetical protein FA04_14580 [Ensifer adhaerens]|uniref:Scaffolding protein n=1 Tax=Ensifer adhaerens TaxID=106592 RepID=A0ABY8HCJ7_ENSAD|nr:hypothetical protein [Ensifer adhaerens]ANK73738.1 hypothetical protein FA04_14580 [Ensifer adhaerens]KDP70301.1 hypothetical protein FA04_29130 [Ensifer adhaerens]WFP89822.1 hypothetical protein P4B07_14810 [Ensifer adhaerens]